MKITTTKSDLFAALQIVDRATSTRSVLPALGGVLLETGDGEVVLRGTDSEIGITHHLTAVRIDEPGSVLVSGQLLTNVVRNLPDGEVSLATDEAGASAEITAGTGRFNLRVLNAADFPPSPEVDATPIAIESGPFGEAIELVSKAASRDEVRPVLTGVLVQAAEGKLTLVATDSYRLSVRQTGIGAGGEGFEAIIPARALRELTKIVSAEGVSEVSIRISANQAVFNCGGTSLNTRLIEGQFPNWQKLIPSEFDYHADVPQEELLEIARRVGYLAQRNAPLRIGLEEGEMTVSAETPDVGEASETLPVDYSGDLLEISFNPQYFIDGVDSIEGETLRLKVSSPLRPGLLQAASDESFSYLIMPIRPNS